MNRRLFIGIAIPSKLKSQLQEAVKELVGLYPDIRPIPQENFHITLKFLGSTPLAPSIISKRLQQKLQGQAGFSVTPSSFGLLVGKSTSLICEIVPAEEMLRTYHKINNELFMLGFERDGRGYHPHITLGKIEDLIAFRFPKRKFPTFLCDEIIVFQSIQKSGLVEYVPLERIKLG